MEMGERKRKILQAIVDDYINTAEPVGSRAIAKKFELGLSSATIRNEMADLEEMGYIAQPHTSAGRIPSDMGYRLYVDSLMRQYKMTMTEIDHIRSSLEIKINKLDTLMHQIGNAVSDITNYTTMVTSPTLRRCYLKKIDVILLDGGNLLLVIITNEGLVRNQMFRAEIAIDAKFAQKLCEVLNKNLHGLTIEDITVDVVDKIQDELGSHYKILKPILKFILETIYQLDDSDVFLESTTALLNYPEYNDLERVKQLLHFLEDKNNLQNVISKDIVKNEKVNVVIGKENKFYQLHDCSLVTANYSVGDKILGTIGVIGPKRMDYAKVVTSLDSISGYVNKILKQLYFENESE